ncbi:MAG TPA: hypothetical protein VFA60_14150 [Terriglobales bacterium]|nr:hypothetical protein [Terriglobales bacterium]
MSRKSIALVALLASTSLLIGAQSAPSPDAGTQKDRPLPEVVRSSRGGKRASRVITNEDLAPRADAAGDNRDSAASDAAKPATGDATASASTEVSGETAPPPCAAADALHKLQDDEAAASKKLQELRAQLQMETDRDARFMLTNSERITQERIAELKGKIADASKPGEDPCAAPSAGAAPAGQKESH